MDSVTQITLGAAVGEAVLGRKVGNRAILWGAIAGTLPDLDVFIPLGDAVKDFTYHRAASHSLFVLALLTPLLVWLINRVHTRHRQYTRQWGLMIYLVFATHVLLDSFTAYGTQIFWPFVTTPMTWSTIFIIDPLYTIPLLVGVIAALVMTRHSSRGHRINHVGLLVSSLYLSWTLIAKLVVQNNVEDALDKQNISYQRIFTVPTPFNSLLWRAVVRDEAGYYEGYYSLLDSRNDIRFRYYASDEKLLAGIEQHWPVQRLKWFSKGFYSVSRKQNDIVISDLRMGMEPSYVFSFKVGEISNPHAVPSTPKRVNQPRDLAFLKHMWTRIWDDTYVLVPATTGKH
jgi:inner membrane protein